MVRSGFALLGSTCFACYCDIDLIDQCTAACMNGNNLSHTLSYNIPLFYRKIKLVLNLMLIFIYNIAINILYFRNKA